MTSAIDAIDVHLLAVPLTQPYRLAFGPVDHDDTILVQLADADGRRGFGEATLLTGYTDETLAQGWPLARELAASLAGVDCDAFAQRIGAIAARAPFVATAFRSALDMLQRHPLLAVDAPLRVPILGLLQGEGESALADAFARLLADGYRTVKVKVGFDVASDVAQVATIQRVVAGRARSASTPTRVMTRWPRRHSSPASIRRASSSSSNRAPPATGPRTARRRPPPRAPDCR